MCSVKSLAFFFFEPLYSAFLFVSSSRLEARLELYPLWAIHFDAFEVSLSRILSGFLPPRNLSNKPDHLPEPSRTTSLQLWWGMARFSHTSPHFHSCSAISQTYKKHSHPNKPGAFLSATKGAGSQDSNTLLFSFFKGTPVKNSLQGKGFQAVGNVVTDMAEDMTHHIGPITAAINQVLPRCTANMSETNLFV